MEDSDLLQPGVSIKPQVSVHDVENILSDVYGFKCVFMKEMNGYDDNNYHVKVEAVCDNAHVQDINPQGYVLKIINSLDSNKTEFFEAQTELLLHLRRKGFCCSTPIKTKAGHYYVIYSFISGKHLVRLLEFIDGCILHQLETPSNDFFYECGKYVAKLDNALTDFHHPAYESRKSLWTLDSVPQLNQFLFVIKDDFKKQLITDVIKEFETRVISASKNFGKGVIHGDFNEQNILVAQNKTGNWEVKGVIDFGDSQFNCYLYEVALAMAYMMLQGQEDNNLEVGGHVLAGYTRVRYLPDEEFSLLKLCITARLCQSLVLGAYSSLQDPSNSYILTTAKPGWALLQKLWSKPENELLSDWRKICRSRT